jgi:tripeptide aminopeptidase
MANPKILDDFLELVQIDAASHSERAVADVVKRKMAEAGVELTEDDAAEKIGGTAGNLYGVLDGGLPGAVLLNAHLDRVANGIGIKPVIDDGVIRSDGRTILAADDLSGVAALIDSVRRLKAGGRKFPRVEYVFTVAEEAGLWGSKNFDTSKLTAEAGYAFDSPGRLGRIISAAPGQVWLTVKVHGRAAHAGNCPEKGVNAVKVLSKILVGVRDGRLDEESTANFAVLDCGTKVTNIVQAYAECRGEMRSRSLKTLNSYVDYFKKWCREAAEGTGASVETEVVPCYTAFSLDESAPVVQAAARALKHMGITPAVNAGGGGMDANVWNAAGIPVVGIATGYSGNHGTSEQIVMEDLLRSGELAEQLVLAWADRNSQHC